MRVVVVITLVTALLSAALPAKEPPEEVWVRDCASSSRPSS